MTLDVATLVAFLLVLARSAAWVMTAPVFSAQGMASMGRLALALALSLFLAPLEAGRAAALPADVGPFVVILIGQVLIGLLLGWATGILLRAFEAAGAMIDLSSGFAVGALLDPMSGNVSAVFARFANLLFVTLLVATNGHLVLVEGFTRSFDAVPAGGFPDLTDGVGAVIGGVSGLLVAALEIGAPVLGVLFMTEVVLAVAARFAPQANVFLVGLPLKVGIALFGLGASLVYLPRHIDGLLEQSIRLGASLL